MFNILATKLGVVNIAGREIITASTPPRYAAPVPVICSCPPNQLCRTCLDRDVECLGGVAQRRGERWADDVAELRPDLLGRPWPPLEGKALAIAVRRLADLTGDHRVVEALLPSLQIGAERAWGRRRER
jgi:hypothetical protein